MELILKIFIYIICVLFIVFTKFSELKAPYDEKKQRYKFFRNFWPYYWDNTMIWALGGLLGAIGSHELAVPIFHFYFPLPDATFAGINYTGLIGCTLAGTWFFGKFIHPPKNSK